MEDEEDYGKIKSSDGKLTGTIILEDEESYGCDLEGCSGHALTVAWPDGDETTICSAGVTYDRKGNARIAS
jgi:hypothetical protein